MPYHIRVRPTALIIKDESILLVEYDDEGIHYNLPGGGAEPGETVIEGVRREVFEETMAEVEVGPLAFVYECAPHNQSGDYPDAPQPNEINKEYPGIIYSFESKFEKSSPIHIQGDLYKKLFNRNEFVGKLELDNILISNNFDKVWIQLDEINSRYNITGYISGPAGNIEEANEIARSFLENTQ